MLRDTSGLLCYLHRDELQHEKAVQLINGVIGEPSLCRGESVMSLLEHLRRLISLRKNPITEDHIHREIDELHQQIIRWQKILNEEGLWLFTATLALWGVPLLPLSSHKLIVAIIVLIAFFARIRWRVVLEKKPSFRA